MKHPNSRAERRNAAANAKARSRAEFKAKAGRSNGRDYWQALADDATATARHARSAYGSNAARMFDKREDDRADILRAAQVREARHAHH
jgi:hypothetical protein